MKFSIKIVDDWIRTLVLVSLSRYQIFSLHWTAKKRHKISEKILGKNCLKCNNGGSIVSKWVGSTFPRETISSVTRFGGIFTTTGPNFYCWKLPKLEKYSSHLWSHWFKPHLGSCHDRRCNWVWVSARSNNPQNAMWFENHVSKMNISTRLNTSNQTIL